MVKTPRVFRKFHLKTCKVLLFCISRLWYSTDIHQNFARSPCVPLIGYTSTHAAASSTSQILQHPLNDQSVVCTFLFRVFKIKEAQCWKMRLIAGSSTTSVIMIGQAEPWRRLLNCPISWLLIANWRGFLERELAAEVWDPPRLFYRC